MGPKCSMNMLWNTQIVDTCIVFRSWHIGSNTAFVFSCLAIVGLGLFYEYLREFQRKVDVRIAQRLAAQGKGKYRSPTRPDSGRNSPVGHLEETVGLLSGSNVLNKSSTGTRVPAHLRALRAALYGLTVFLSFFLMLVFMTYNAYLIIAVVIGAAVGHYIFGSTINVEALLSDTEPAKSMACH